MCEGSLSSAFYAQFETSLYTSLEATLPTLFDRDNGGYESVFVDIFGNEEFIGMDGYVRTVLLVAEALIG